MEMSTLECLFMGIFNRKRRIEQQLRKQEESYGHSVACSIVVEGRHPPPWLWKLGQGTIACPDPRGLNREQLISGIIFPLSGDNNHLANPSTFSCMPSNLFYEMPGLDSRQNVERTKRKASTTGEKNHHIECEVVEERSELDIHENIPCPTSRQTNSESHIKKKAKVSDLKEVCATSQYTGKTGHSGATNEKADFVKDFSNAESVVAVQNAGSKSQDKNAVFMQADGLANSQNDAQPSQLELICLTCDNMDNVDVAEMHATDTAAEMIISGTIPFAEASKIPNTVTLVEQKPLGHNRAESCCHKTEGSSCVLNEELLVPSSESSLKSLVAVQSLPEELTTQATDLHITSNIHVEQGGTLHFGEGISGMEIDSIPHGVKDDEIELLVVEDSECSSHSESGQKFSEISVIAPYLSSSRDDVCNSKGFSDLQEIREISLSLSAEYHDEDHFIGNHNEAPSCDAVLSQDRAKPIVHQTNLEFIDVQGSDLRKLSSGSALDSNLTISDVNLRSDVLQAVIEESFSGACDSLMDKIVKEVDALGAEIDSKVAHRVPTECQARYEISEVTETASNFRPALNVTESLHALVRLKQKSDITKNTPISSSQVADCVVTSYLGCSGDQFSTLDISESSSAVGALQIISKGSSLESPKVKENDRHADLNSFQVPVQSFPGQGIGVLKVEETGSSVLETVRRGDSSGNTLEVIETGDDDLVRSQICNDKVVDSHKVNVPGFPSSNKDSISLPDEETPSGTNPWGLQESASGIMSKDAKNFNANHRYFLRSSSRSGEICDRGKSNGSSLPCCEGDSMLMAYRNNAHAKNVLIKVVAPKISPPLHCVENLRALPEARCLVRSSSDCHDDSTSLKSDRPSIENFRSSSAGIDHKCRFMRHDSSNLVPKSANTLGNPVGSKVGTEFTVEDKIECKSQSRNTLESVERLQSISQFSHIKLSDFLTSETLHQNEKSPVLEDGSGLSGIDQVLVSPSLERETVVVAENCSTSYGYEVGSAGFLNFVSQKHHAPVGFDDLGCCMDSFLEDVSGSLCQNDVSDKDKELYNASYQFTSNLARSEYSHNCCETMPELEGFNIELPSASDRSFMYKFPDVQNVSIGQGPVFEQLCKSRSIFSPMSDASVMYKKDDIPGSHQLLLPGMLENTKLGCSFNLGDVDMKQFSANSSCKLVDLCCSIGSQFDGYLGRSHSLSSSNKKFASEARNPPLTPISKLSHGRLSQKRSSSSKSAGSEPELICFRISEDSITTDENGEHAKPVAPICKASLRDSKLSTSRKALSDVTSLHQRLSCKISNSGDHMERDSLKSVNSESKSNLQSECAGNGKSVICDHENLRHSTRGSKYQKEVEPVCQLSVKSKVSAKASEQNSSHHKMEKGGMPANIVSNMSSFIPLVRQKQQGPLPFKGKRGIKVKALEAAEVAKRLEGKKKLEREMRKAASKLEREKLEQEKAKQLELKQKAKEEERRKKETNVAARKRQRDGERKSKNVKRRCIEEIRKIQGCHEENMTDDKEKDLRLKSMGEKQKKKKLVTNEIQAHKKVEKGGKTTQATELQPHSSWFESGASKCVDVDSESEGLSKQEKIISKGGTNFDLPQETVQPILSTGMYQDMQSYEMSPYQDSDDEVVDDDNWRKRKYIPLWARRENLAEVILSTQHLDPKEIFRRKSSFNLFQVLPSRFLQPRR
ncbi:hypothetical protein AXF42_Ash011939 [Apostasia shenzhenica]|uniref:Inner centromere protein ARK-binding domain-containing protein n=1 Tax=Apostasia shenzhenica TaxID=1088818 RepID=A0A2I0AW93_9ASPA|nr:hypothetical protein AXF42_Ash011939 [Apostasia shenzhenica]